MTNALVKQLIFMQNQYIVDDRSKTRTITYVGIRNCCTYMFNGLYPACPATFVVHTAGVPCAIVPW